MKNIALLLTFTLVFSSCSSIMTSIVDSILNKTPEQIKADNQRNYENKVRENRKTQEAKLQSQIESDRDFFIQNCNTIDSAAAREECLRNIPK